MIGARPHVRERLYPGGTAVNGLARWQSAPGGAWVFADSLGRYFVLRVPDLSALDTTIPTLFDGTLTELGTPPEALGLGLYVGDGSSPSVASQSQPPKIA